MIPKSIGSGDLLYALAISALFVGVFILISTFLRLVISPWRSRRKVSKRVQEERLTEIVRSGIFRANIDGPKTPILRVIETIFNRKRLENLQRALFQADIYTSLPRFLNIVILSVCVGFWLAGFSSVAFSCSLP
jgi:hypothetical protein